MSQARGQEHKSANKSISQYGRMLSRGILKSSFPLRIQGGCQHRRIFLSFSLEEEAYAQSYFLKDSGVPVPPQLITWHLI